MTDDPAERPVFLKSFDELVAHMRACDRQKDRWVLMAHADAFPMFGLLVNGLMAFDVPVAAVVNAEVNFREFTTRTAAKLFVSTFSHDDVPRQVLVGAVRLILRVDPVFEEDVVLSFSTTPEGQKAAQLFWEGCVNPSSKFPPRDVSLN